MDKEKLKIAIGLLTMLIMGYLLGVGLNYDEDCEFDVLVDQKFNYMKIDNVSGGASLAQGYYSSPDYFCVKTKGRSFEAIAETTFHELAHHYSMQEEEHFCGVN